MSKTASCVFLVLVVSIGTAYAAGGIYIDNLQIANNNKVIFSDTFDTGKLTGWTRMTNATITHDADNKQQGALHLNKRRSIASTAYRSVSAQNTGVMEMSMDVYCTAANEQYDRRANNGGCGTFLRIYSGNSTHYIAAKIQLNPCQSTYQLGIQQTNQAVHTKLPVLSPEEWATLTLRLDQSRSTATLLLNGKAQISMKYDPRLFESIRELGFVTGLGDGSLRTN